MEHYEEIVGKVNVLNISGGVWREGGVICHVKHTEITLRDNHCHKKTKAKPCTAVSGISDGSVCGRVVVADACTKCPFKSMP